MANLEKMELDLALSEIISIMSDYKIACEKARQKGEKHPSPVEWVKRIMGGKPDRSWVLADLLANYLSTGLLANREVALETLRRLQELELIEMQRQN